MFYLTTFYHAMPLGCKYIYVRDLLCLSGPFYWNLATSVKCTKFNYFSVCTSSVRDNFFVCVHACLCVFTQLINSCSCSSWQDSGRRMLKCIRSFETFPRQRSSSMVCVHACERVCAYVRACVHACVCMLIVRTWMVFILAMMGECCHTYKHATLFSVHTWHYVYVCNCMVPSYTNFPSHTCTFHTVSRTHPPFTSHSPPTPPPLPSPTPPPDYSCALHREILAQGRMYVTQSYLCFYANIFTWETLVSDTSKHSHSSYNLLACIYGRICC